MSAATRFLLVSLIAVWALAVSSALGTYAHTIHLARSQLLARLAVPARVEAALEAGQLTELRLRADHLARDPAFVDYVAQSLIPNPASGNAIDSTSIADLLSSRRQGYDLAVVLTPGGTPAARSGILLAHDTDIRRDPAVMRAIASQQPQQEVRVEQGQVILVAIEPLSRGGALQGVLFIAKRLDNSFTAAISGIADTGIALLATPSSATETPPETGLSPATLRAIRTDLASAPATTSGQSRLLDLHVAGQTLPAIVTSLRSGGGHAALVALDPGFDAAGEAIKMAWPLWLGIMALAMLATLHAWLRWRSTDAPLERICAILERGVQGDHELVIRTRGSGMPRRLRDGLNALLAQTARRERH